MVAKVYAPKGCIIVEIEDGRNSLAFDISRVRSGLIHSMRSPDGERLTTADNVYVVFGPRFTTLDLEAMPHGKLLISMEYSNAQAFIRDEGK